MDTAVNDTGKWLLSFGIHRGGRAPRFSLAA